MGGRRRWLLREGVPHPPKQALAAMRLRCPAFLRLPRIEVARDACLGFASGICVCAAELAPSDGPSHLTCAWGERRVPTSKETGVTRRCQLVQGRVQTNATARKTRSQSIHSPLPCRELGPFIIFGCVIPTTEECPEPSSRDTTATQYAAATSPPELYDDGIDGKIRQCYLLLFPPATQLEDSSLSLPRGGGRHQHTLDPICRPRSRHGQEAIS